MPCTAPSAAAATGWSPRPDSTAALCRRLAAGLLALSAAGCAPSPPADAARDCPGARSVTVIDHGRHVGLVLPRSDLVTAVPGLAEYLPPGANVEVGWGDAAYYRADDPGAGLALWAALWPTSAVLHLVTVPADVASFFLAGEIATVPVTSEGYRQLVAFVAGAFARDAGGGPRRLGPPLYGDGGFFAAGGRFHLFHTCNTWVARALARAGAPVTARWTLTADGLMAQLRGLGCPAGGGA